jgi:hypothetical protein
MSQIWERCERKILIDTSQDGEYIYVYVYNFILCNQPVPTEI